MKGQLSCLILLGILAFCSCNPTKKLNTNELEAKNFVQAANERTAKLNEDLRFLSYELETKEGWEIDNLENRYFNLTNTLAELARESKQFDSSQFKDAELKYIFKILGQGADEFVLGNWWVRRMLEATIAIEEMGTRRNIAKFRNKRVNLALIPDIQKIIAYTNSTSELKYYWKQWRERNSNVVLKNIITITDGVLEAAKATGVSPLEFYSKEFNITEMEHIMNETRPLYLQLHAFIRSHLHQKYGNDIIDPNGVIPDHLFRQVLAQTWTNASIIEAMFPLNKLPNYNNILKQNNFDALELYKSASRFYISLGFDPLPESYWGTEIRPRKNEDGPECKPSLYDTPPKVYMFYCHKMDFKHFLQAHRYIGQIYYALEKVNLPTYYLNGHNLESSVGEAAILSASTLGHLKTIGLLDSFETSQEVEFNRLLRIGFHTLLSIPQQFVHSKVMSDFFAGKVELGLLNKHYWKLMDQYMGIGPPMNRVSDTYDFPNRFYIELNQNEEGRKFNSEIFGYQFYKKLCQISGQYTGDDSLHKCDFYGSKEVGDALKKMMKLGSSKELNKVLETIFPENPKLSSEGLLDYYSPLKSWLTEKNKEANVELGWTPSTKKVKRVILDSGEDYDDE